MHGRSKMAAETTRSTSRQSQSKLSTTISIAHRNTAVVLWLILLSIPHLITCVAMPTPKIKLTYFDIEGRAECVRLALVLSGTPFEDERVKGDQWKELKPKTPGGQLPVMTVDDGPMRTQSSAMLRWVGANFSKTLYPLDKIFDVEEAMGVLLDFEKAFFAPLYMGMRPQIFGYPEGYTQTDEGKKLLKDLREGFVKDELPSYLKRLTDMISAHGGRWLVAGEEPTVADCFAVPNLRALSRGYIDHVPSNCLDEFPVVVKYIKDFCAIEGIKGRYTSGIF